MKNKELLKKISSKKIHEVAKEYFGDDYKKVISITDTFLKNQIGSAAISSKISALNNPETSICYVYFIANELRKLFVELANNEAKIFNDSNQKIASCNKTIEDASNVIDKLNESYGQLKTNYDNAKNELDIASREYSKLLESNKKLSEEYEKCNVAYNKLLSDYDTIKSISEDLRKIHISKCDEYQEQISNERKKVDKLIKINSNALEIAFDKE